MAEERQTALTPERIREAAAAAVAAGGDIRGQVRRLALQAFKARRLDPQAINAVMRAVTEGIGLGAVSPSSGVGSALADGVQGLDDALKKAAEAISLALQQLAAQSQDFTARDLRPSLDHLKRLEEDFVATVHAVGGQSGAQVKQSLTDIAAHMARAGTDTGGALRAAAEPLSNRLNAAAAEAGAAGAQAAQDVGLRLAALAGGILAGMADAIHEETPPRQDG
ncbi:MAG TPA: hypothetical protein DEP05_08440 [Betaproteobacteria bacterium]|nr:hypothetical protein [Betaproteobacteria bacterium]